MKTAKKLFTRMFKNLNDGPIFRDQIKMKALQPFHPAPSYWALIPLKIEQIKYPQRDTTE